MKVSTDVTPFVDHATSAFYTAAQDTLDYAKMTAPVISGRYRGSLKMWRRKRKYGPTATIGSRTVPYAGVINRGGGPHLGWAHRGPHIKRADASNNLAEARDQFAEFYTRRLKSTAIRGSAYLDIGHGMTYERVAPELQLSGDPE